MLSELFIFLLQTNLIKGPDLTFLLFVMSLRLTCSTALLLPLYSCDLDRKNQKNAPSRYDIARDVPSLVQRDRDIF
jgi:hypothetical protein